jgi:hypothetical protein
MQVIRRMQVIRVQASRCRPGLKYSKPRLAAGAVAEKGQTLHILSELTVLNC